MRCSKLKNVHRSSRILKYVLCKHHFKMRILEDAFLVHTYIWWYGGIVETTSLKLSLFKLYTLISQAGHVRLYYIIAISPPGVAREICMWLWEQYIFSRQSTCGGFQTPRSANIIMNVLLGTALFMKSMFGFPGQRSNN